MTERHRIDRLGHRGDGVADTEEGPLYVPFALPGETVEVAREDGRARLVDVIEASPARIGPLCRHFGDCGGCAVQTLGQADYLAWKRGLVSTALAQRGLDVAVEPTRSFPIRSRRRAIFAARRAESGIVIGYHARQTHRLVPVTECPVVVPEIEAALPKLGAWLAPLLPAKGEARITVTATRPGLDVAVAGEARGAQKIHARLAAAPLAGLDLARLTVDGELVLVAVEPEVEIDGIPVVLPAGAFVQAVEAAEREMAALVVDWLGGAKGIADLYAGLGAFALRLARSSRVLAVEGDDAALDALAQAARRTPGLKPVETLRRDLQRQPLSAAELKSFDAVVFDPPRAGAAPQAEELARSGVKRIAAVSCNPATLARDLRILVDGGYGLKRVVPVDQFVHSAHIEAVALLERSRKTG